MLKIAEVGRGMACHQNGSALAGNLAAGVDARACVQLRVIVAVIDRAIHGSAADLHGAQCCTH